MEELTARERARRKMGVADSVSTSSSGLQRFGSSIREKGRQPIHYIVAIAVIIALLAMWMRVTDDELEISSHIKDAKTERSDRGDGNNESLPLKQEDFKQLAKAEHENMSKYFTENRIEALKLAKEAHTYFEDGNTGKALEFIDAALEKDPEYAYNYALRAMVHETSMKFQQAAEDWESALKYSPNMYEFNFNLGLSLSQSLQEMPAGSAARFKAANRVIESLTRFMDNMKQIPEDQKIAALVLTAAAHVDIKTEEHQRKAISLLEEALKLNPQDELAHYNIGTAYAFLFEKLKDPEMRKLAIKHLKTAATLDPTNKMAKQMLAGLGVKARKRQQSQD